MKECKFCGSVYTALALRLNEKYNIKYLYTDKLKYIVI